eukprot:282212-Chlamydomonas_euryale.AAC.1
MDGWMERWMDGWKDGWMDGKLDGWMERCMDGGEGEGGRDERKGGRKQGGKAEAGTGEGATCAPKGTPPVHSQNTCTAHRRPQQHMYRAVRSPKMYCARSLKPEPLAGPDPIGCCVSAT